MKIYALQIRPSSSGEVVIARNRQVVGIRDLRAFLDHVRLARKKGLTGGAAINGCFEAKGAPASKGVPSEVSPCLPYTETQMSLALVVVAEMPASKASPETVARSATIGGRPSVVERVITSREAESDENRGTRPCQAQNEGH